jgi:hypothetical protein
MVHVVYTLCRTALRRTAQQPTYNTTAHHSAVCKLCLCLLLGCCLPIRSTHAPVSPAAPRSGTPLHSSTAWPRLLTCMHDVMFTRCGARQGPAGRCSTAQHSTAACLNLDNADVMHCTCSQVAHNTGQQVVRSSAAVQGGHSALHAHRLYAPIMMSQPPKNSPSMYT